MTIRLLNKNEFELYRDLRLGCLKTHSDNFSTTYEEEVNIPMKLAHVFSDPATNDFIYGAFEGNKLIGICGFVQETKVKTKHNGEITQMFVDPAYSRKGIGADLLKAAVDKAFSNPEIEQIRLTVIASNERAVALYTKVGFVRYGLLEHYYKKAEGNYYTETFMVLAKNRYLDLNK